MNHIIRMSFRNLVVYLSQMRWVGGERNEDLR